MSINRSGSLAERASIGKLLLVPEGAELEWRLNGKLLKPNPSTQLHHAVSWLITVTLVAQFVNAQSRVLHTKDTVDSSRPPMLGGCET